MSRVTRPKARSPKAVARKSVRAVNRRTKKTVANPWLKRTTRLGYVARGCLYGAVGILAIRSALGWPGDTEDLRGRLVLLPNGPVRDVILVAVIAGLFAYGLWGFVRAVYDPLNRGGDLPGLAARIGFAWSGLNYMLLVVFACAFLVGASNSDGSNSLSQTVSGVMARPGGWIALTIAGAIGTLSGLGQFVDAYKAPFRKDLNRSRMTAAERHIADTLGRVGMFSRGIVFSMLGWFIFQAGISRDPARSENVRQVFQTLASLPLGHSILMAVAIGFIALAGHSVACARWVRMPQTPASAKPT